jgi:multimeric flavodoxin WrbA
MEDKTRSSTEYLKKKRRPLFLTTSNRWSGHKEVPKSTALARRMAAELGNAEVLDVSSLRIDPCEGNISSKAGNDCGVKAALLKDKEKNPSGLHRCWATYNSPGDELWKVTKSLFDSDCVVFFASVRWGQTNSVHQRLIERLSWIENRRSTLGEGGIVGGIDAGIILTGHNWRGEEVLRVQKEVLGYFGFNVVPEICWNWQYTGPEDETREGYVEAVKAFERDFLT